MDYLNKFTRFQILKNPTVNRGISALCQEPGEIHINSDSFHNAPSFPHFAAPFILRKYSQPMYTQDKCFTLHQQMFKKQMPWLLFIACHRMEDKTQWDPWGSSTKGQIQTEQSDGRQRHSCNSLLVSAFEKGSSASEIHSLPNMKKSGNHI